MASPVRKADVIPFDAMPPANIEAEQGVIGGMLLDNSTIDDLAAFLSPADFYRDQHGILCQAIYDIRAMGSPVDVLILIEHLDRNGDLTRAGGDEVITKALEETPSGANAVYYGQVVKQRAVSRSLAEAADEIRREAYSNMYTATELAERAENRVYAISDVAATGTTIELSEAVEGAMQALQRRAGGEIVGVPSGWTDLDDMLDGFQPGSLTVVGARPSAGKTAFALGICTHNALKPSPVTPFLVSLEMGRQEIALRLIQSLACVDSYRLKKPWLLDDDERERVEWARQTFLARSFPVDDTSARTVVQIAANARRQRARRGVGVIVVDYLQLVDPENSKENRQEQVAKVSRRLKVLARELSVPVIALSQINRQVESREDHRPRMADLRESGAIEQDADVVLMLHRPEVYDAADKPGVAEVIIAKNRNGATGTIELAFSGVYSKFDNLCLYPK
jgi:replicative DNA helicase